MKKLTLAIIAVVMGFVMAACNTTSKKETIMKATDEFFTQAEQELNETVTTGEDFMIFYEVMNDDKNEFMKTTFAPYMDEEGNIKGFTEEEWEELQTYIYDRATAYNKVEAAKAAEFITPALDDLETAVDELYAQFQAGTELENESVLKFGEAYEAFSNYAYYDNVLPEISERYNTVSDKLGEMDEVLNAKLRELFPEE